MGLDGFNSLAHIQASQTKRLSTAKQESSVKISETLRAGREDRRLKRAGQDYPSLPLCLLLLRAVNGST